MTSRPAGATTKPMTTYTITAATNPFAFEDAVNDLATGTVASLIELLAATDLTPDYIETYMAVIETATAVA